MRLAKRAEEFLTLTLWALLVAVLLRWGLSDRESKAERSEAEAQRKAHLALIEGLRNRKAKADTVWRVDSVAFAAWDTIYVHTTDTLRVDGTLYVNKETADSTVASARRACASCASAKAKADTVATEERVARVRAEQRAERAEKDNTKEKASWGIVGAALGFLIGSLR